MSLIHSPDGTIDRKVLLAVAGAIRSLETVTGTIVEYEVGASDAPDLHYIMRRLWALRGTSISHLQDELVMRELAVSCRIVLT